MKKTTLLTALSVIAVLASGETTQAGWNNVVLTNCNDCNVGPIRRIAQRIRGEDCPPEQVTRKVEYEETVNYEPVTVMKRETYYEEVPVKVKSYYFDPVTTYTYRSYYDSCSGQCQEVAVPRTSYVKKEECNTVMKTVERMRMVPVQMQRKVVERRPVYTYYGPVTRSYGPLEGSTSSRPEVDIYRNQPSVSPPERMENIPAQNLKTTPGGGLSNPKPQTNNYTPSAKNAYSTSFSKNSSIRGEVVAPDKKTPMPQAKLVFVDSTDLSNRVYATADDFGGFDLSLPAGEWYMYVGAGNGRADYHQKISVAAGDSRSFTVLSR